MYHVSLELFYESISIRSLESKRVYSTNLNKYAEKYNLKESDPRKIEAMMIDFIVALKKEKSHSAIRNYVSAILAYYKINDIILNTTKINKFILRSKSY